MIVGWTALILWPIVCVILYMRARPSVALCVSIMGGFLLLPNGVSHDFPLLPQLNKTSIPSLMVLLLTAATLAKARETQVVLDGWFPRNGLMLALVALLILGTFGTILTNSDPLFYGPVTLPALRLYDGFSMLLSVSVMMIPFFAGRRILATAEGHRILVLTVVISALIYTLPILFEVRMSPQLHRLVYGFHAHDFLQTLRGGGFRPTVFLQHGLLTGIFLACAIIGAAGLFRADTTTDRLKWLFATVWLFAVLVLAKSLGAFLITLAVAPIVLLCSQRVQLLAATCLAVIVLVYPVLRSVDVVPTDRLVSFAYTIDAQRAESLAFRFHHEDTLLAKAAERPVFGWGIWSRNRVYDERGRDISVTDGWWIGAFGVGGWVQYIATFGLLCGPIIALCLRRRDEIDPITVTLVLMLVINLIDLLPNASVMPLTWLMAGALAGRMELRQGALQPDQTPAKDPPRGQLAYARRFPGKEKTPALAGRETTDKKRPSYRRSKHTPG